MTPEALEALHAAAFTYPRPWRAAEFAALLRSPHITLYAQTHGFALTRALAGEGELLTLAVAPTYQRQGIARGLLTRWLADADATLDRVFLEVAADNRPALALYQAMGFDVIATRPGYYRTPANARVDAQIMERRF